MTATIIRLAKEGAAPGDRLPATLVGMLLWWRVWASLLLFTTPAIVGLIALSYIEPAAAVWVTWLVAMVAVPNGMRASPSYEIKNQQL